MCLEVFCVRSGGAGPPADRQPWAVSVIDLTSSAQTPAPSESTGTSVTTSQPTPLAEKTSSLNPASLGSRREFPRPPRVAH